jgi:hypothetical protein
MWLEDSMIRERASVRPRASRKPTNSSGGAATGTAAGLWIDHRKAVIVSMTAHGDTTRLIVSRVEKQLGRFGGLRSTTPYEAQLVPADKRQEQRFHGHLAVYYDAVIAAIRGADAILVFGPGEAKVELRQRLAKTGRPGQVVAFETFDKMTDREIAAKVWQHFSSRQSVTHATVPTARRRISARRLNEEHAAVGGTP